MKAFGARLDQEEYDATAIFTAPSVKFRARIKDNETIRRKRYGGQADVSGPTGFEIANAHRLQYPDSLPIRILQIATLDPSRFPDATDVDAFLEPMIALRVLIPGEYMTAIDALCVEYRGKRCEITCIDGEHMLMKSRLPLAEVVVDLFARLKRITRLLEVCDFVR